MLGIYCVNFHALKNWYWQPMVNVTPWCINNLRQLALWNRSIPITVQIFFQREKRPLQNILQWSMWFLYHGLLTVFIYLDAIARYPMMKIFQDYCDYYYTMSYYERAGIVSLCLVTVNKNMSQSTSCPYDENLEKMLIDGGLSTVW